MALEQDLTDRFHYGSLIEITLLAREPDGEVIASPASQVVTILFAETRGGAAVASFNGSPQVTLQNANTGEYLIQLNASDYSALSEGTRYYYEIWTKLSTNPPLLQVRGEINLRTTTGI